MSLVVEIDTEEASVVGEQVIHGEVVRRLLLQCGEVVPLSLLKDVDGKMLRDGEMGRLTFHGSEMRSRSADLLLKTEVNWDRKAFERGLRRGRSS